MDFNAGRNMSLVKHVVVSGLSFFGLIWIPVSATAAVDIEGAVEVGLTYTDNISLADVNKDNELVYRIAPSFQFSQESARISALVNYRMDGFYYSDLGESSVNHQFDGNIEAALIPENVFLDIGASRYQSIVNPDAQIPPGILQITANRVDRDEYYIGPRFQFELGRSVTMQGAYRLGWVKFNLPEIDNLDQLSTGSFTIDNYRRNTGLTWAARYRWRRVEYDIFDPWEFQQASGELGFWAGKNLRVFASGGKESAWDMPLDPGLEDTFWELGFAKQVGTSFSTEFAAGERTFGSSWRGNLTYEFRNGTTSLEYAEMPTTGGQNSFNPGSFRSPNVPNDTLVRPGRAQRYVRKRFQWILSYNLRYTNINLTVFDGEQSNRTEADGVPLPNVAQRGVIVNTTWQMGAKTDFSIGGSLYERQASLNSSTDLIRVFVATGYELGPRTRLSLRYVYAEQKDGRAIGATRNYVANSVTLLVSRIF